MPELTRRFGSGLLAATLAAGLLLAGGPYAGTAYACSCASTSLKDEVERSDAVFSGEVQGVDEGVAPDGAYEDASPGPIEATGKVSFEVKDSWKGVGTETVEVYGQGDGVNCYNVFEEGEAYLVYASHEGGAGEAAPLENNACGGTKPLVFAKADLRFLGPSTGTLPETGGPSLPPVGVLVAAAVFVVSVAMLCRR